MHVDLARGRARVDSCFLQVGRSYIHVRLAPRLMCLLSAQSYIISLDWTVHIQSKLGLEEYSQVAWGDFAMTSDD